MYSFWVTNFLLKPSFLEVLSRSGMQSFGWNNRLWVVLNSELLAYMYFRLSNKICHFADFVPRNTSCYSDEHVLWPYKDERFFCGCQQANRFRCVIYVQDWLLHWWKMSFKLLFSVVRLTMSQTVFMVCRSLRLFRLTKQQCVPLLVEF